MDSASSKTIHNNKRRYPIFEAHAAGFFGCILSSSVVCPKGP